MTQYEGKFKNLSEFVFWLVPLVHALDDEAVLANLPSEDFEFNPSVLMNVREEAATSGADSGESKASADEQEASQPEDKRDSAP